MSSRASGLAHADDRERRRRDLLGGERRSRRATSSDASSAAPARSARAAATTVSASSGSADERSQAASRSRWWRYRTRSAIRAGIAAEVRRPAFTRSAPVLGGVRRHGERHGASAAELRRVPVRNSPSPADAPSTRMRRPAASSSFEQPSRGRSAPPRAARAAAEAPGPGRRRTRSAARATAHRGSSSSVLVAPSSAKPSRASSVSVVWSRAMGAPVEDLRGSRGCSPARTA